jgi:hypothetical protein
MRRRFRQALPAAGLMFLIYGYFIGGYINNPMTNAAADLAIALVDDHSLQIDRYAGNTGDVSGRNNHVYSGFGPGLGFILAPVYVALKPVIALIPARYLERMDARLYEGAVVHSPTLRPSSLRTVALLVVVAGTLGLGIPLSIVCAFRTLSACRLYVPQLGRRELVALFALYSFGTLAAGFASNLAHTAVSALLVWFAVCEGVHVRGRGGSAIRFAAPGFFLGLASIVDYPAVLFSLYAGVFILWLCAARERWKAAAAMGLGAVLPVVSSMGYHFVAFGSAFTTAYRFRIRGEDRSLFDAADVGANLPTPEKLYVAFIGPVSGILLYHPLLVLGLGVSAYFMATEREPARRAFWLLGLATMLTNIGIYSSFPLSVGPGCLPTFAIRYTMYSVPFVVVAVAALWNGVGKELRGVKMGLLAASALNAVGVWAFMLYGVPVYPTRGYGNFLLAIGPGSYTLTKLHEGHILASAVWGWVGFAGILVLLLMWHRAAGAYVSRALEDAEAGDL